MLYLPVHTEIHLSGPIFVLRPFHTCIFYFPRQAIGYSICYKAYSTWQGRYFFVEDIYVRPDHRKRGAGKRIFLEVSARAVALKCPRLEFNVLEWNPARKFYESLGAVDLTAKEGWHYYRVEEKQLAKLAQDLASFKA